MWSDQTYKREPGRVFREGEAGHHQWRLGICMWKVDPCQILYGYGDENPGRRSPVMVVRSWTFQDYCTGKKLTADQKIRVHGTRGDPDPKPDPKPDAKPHPQPDPKQ